MTTYEKSEIAELVDGTLAWNKTRTMMSSHKDDTRFDTYIAVLQERVPWKDPILLPIGENLFIVQAPDDRTVRCMCGHDFGTYTRNWKLQANIRVRDDEESLGEIYPGRRMCDPEWMEIREFICPGCSRLLEVEAVPPGFPIVFDFQPDLERFYSDWLGIPLPDPVTA